MGCWKDGRDCCFDFGGGEAGFWNRQMGWMEQGLQANLSEKQDNGPLFT